MSWPLTGLALLVCSSILPAAQGEAVQGGAESPSYRRSTIGRAVLPDGKAWPSVEVFLVHRPLPERHDLGEPDVIQAQASAKGRFRAKLLERRPYMVWARGKDEKGRLWVSDPHALVFAGQPIKLQRAGKAAFAETVNLRRWDQAKPPAESFRLRFGPMQQTLPVPAGKAENSLVIPPIPYKVGWLEALGAQGELVGELKLKRRSYPIFARTWGYKSPEPIQLRIRTAKDAAVSGAVVSVRIHYVDPHKLDEKQTAATRIESLMPRTPISRWALLGKSGAEGWCKLQLPKQAIDGNSVHFRITAPGMQEKFVRLWPYSDARKTAKADNGDIIDVKLQKGTPIHGRLLWSADKPAARFPLLVLRKAKYMLDKRAHTVEPPGELVRTAEDGTFSFCLSDPANSHFRIITPLDVTLWARMRGAYGDLPLPAGELLLHEGPPRSDPDLGDIALDGLTVVDARLPESQDRAFRPSILLLKDTRDIASSSSEAPHVLARRFGPRGRSIFVMPAGKFDTLVLHPDRGSSQKPLQLTKAQAGKVHRWDVALVPFASILVKVRTGSGKPIQKVPLETMGGGYTHLSKLCSEIYEFNTVSIENTVTDDKGNATLRLLPVAEQTYDVMISWSAARRLKAKVTPVRVSSNAYPESIEIEVGQ